MPPPWAAVLPDRVQSRTDTAAWEWMGMPRPRFAAERPYRVLPLSVSVPSLRMPPASVAELPHRMQLLTVIEEVLWMAPPDRAELPDRVQPLTLPPPTMAPPSVAELPHRMLLMTCTVPPARIPPP